MKFLKHLDLINGTDLATQKPNFDVFGEKLQNIAVKHSNAKPILLYFVKLSTIFCPGLSEKTNFHF